MKADRGIIEEIKDLAWTGHHARAIAAATGALEGRSDRSISMELLGLRSESHVAEGRLDLAIANPSAALTLAYLGKGPFRRPLPLRTIAVIPSADQFVFHIKLDDVDGRQCFKVQVILLGILPLQVETAIIVFVGHFIKKFPG